METTMSDYVTDPALLAQLNGEGGYVTDPALLEQLNAPEQALPPGTLGAEIPEPQGAAPIAPMPAAGAPGVGAMLGETQLGQNIGKVAQPFATAGQKVLTQYVNNPITKLAPDLVAAAAGVPPPYATSQAIGATQGAYNVARNLPTGPAVATTAAAPTAQQIAGNPMLAAMAEAQTEAAVNRTMIQKLAMSKVMQAMGPVLNTAARVAGPAGLAYNAYEAGQMARDTQLGQRLAQGQGGAAQQAFRSMNVPYGAGFNQGITQQQAQNILASKSARDIQAFGGTDFLRKKALGL
jgi:hypothetical protein